MAKILGNHGSVDASGVAMRLIKWHTGHFGQENLFIKADAIIAIRESPKHDLQDAIEVFKKLIQPRYQKQKVFCFWL